MLLPLPAAAGQGQGRCCWSPDTAQDRSQDLSGLQELLLPLPVAPISPSPTSPTNLLDSSAAAPQGTDPSDRTLWSRSSFSALASVRLVTLQVGDEPSVEAPTAGATRQIEAEPSARGAYPLAFVATTPGAGRLMTTEGHGYAPASGAPASRGQTTMAMGTAAEQPPTVVGVAAERPSWGEGAEEQPLTRNRRGSPDMAFHLISRGSPLLEMTRRRTWAKIPEGLPPPLGPPPSPRRICAGERKPLASATVRPARAFTHSRRADG